MVEHVDVPDGERHEPKGINAATVGQVYVADGANSGSWTKRIISYTLYITDVSTAETVYIPIVYAGTIKEINTVLEGAITVADAIITARNSSAASMGTITITQSGSAAGDVDTLSPSSNNIVTADDYITIETDGASTGVQKLWVSVIVEIDS